KLGIGIEESAQSTNIHLAQIVIPDGSLGVGVEMTGMVSWAILDGNGNRTGQYDDQEVSLVIPEPATLGLLVIGGLVALRRRRRS
ncbi:hypothetical protein LCGC14_2075190, partial [marine sediment metagenome]